MQEHDVEAMLDLLAQHGLVEETGGELRGTRRWNAKLQAAAEKLNLVAARTGVNPEGNPLVLAVTQALAAQNLELEEEAFQRAVHVLVLLELTRMSPAKRSQLGFGDLKLEG